MSDEDSVQLLSCDYCGKGIWKGDAFFICKEEECHDLAEEEEREIIYCKDCIKRCEKCHKFFCLDHIDDHKKDCGKEEE